MSRLRLLLARLAVLLGCLGAAQPSSAAPFDLEHPLFQAVLRQHVRDARVDYAGLKARPENLDRYLTELGQVSRAEFKAWREEDQVAFLCNAYNAFTLRLILDHYPVRRIKDIGTLWKGPWDQPVVRLFGETHTLGEVEHRMLRADYSEPRLHFALVCAALGCPPLRSEPYVGARLGEQMADQARAFLRDTSKNRVDPARRTVHLSPIFQWYAGDFEAGSGSVLAALQPYWPAEVSQLSLNGYRIRYTDYDWSLNEWKR